MLKRLTLFMLVAFFFTGCQRGGARSFTYNLRKPQNQINSRPCIRCPMLLAGGIQAAQQPKQIWNIRRIVAWDTSEPREDELDVDVGPNEELLQWVDQGQR